MVRNDRSAAPAGEAARVYTIPPDAPFLETLAGAILRGDFPVPGGAPGPLELPRWTVLLPTRRAARAMREAFLEASGGKALLLPAIRPIGDVDEDAELLAPPGSDSGESFGAHAGAGRAALDVPPAIGALERRLVLAELVRKWSEAAHGPSQAATPGQAARWAEELAALMDSAETEGVDLAALDGLVEGDHAAHWRQTLDFLRILTEHWPAFLAERGVTSPYARRDRLMRASIERLRAEPPRAPVIAAGSTGTVPATAELLETVARLPAGAVVLPGLDLALDEASWDAITAAPGHPEHPQFGMKRLLDRMGVSRGEIATLGCGGDSGPRAGLASEVMRPAGTTAKWRDYAEADGEPVAAAARGITRIDAPTVQDEAEVIALVLRRVAEERPKTAALVTPDRRLARRVAARLERWGLEIDDSAGTPVARTPAGAFMELVLAAAEARYAAAPLMALLKHPLTRLGRSPGAMRAAARALELICLRRPVAGRGFAALRSALETARKEREAGETRHPVLRRLEFRDWREAERLLTDLEEAFAPLESCFADGAAWPASVLARAHVAAARALAGDETGADEALWRGDAGEALSLFFAELLALAESGPAVRAGDWPELFRALLEGKAVRPRGPAHPRLAVWGPLEARLQRPDVVVLGGLNEETWPAVPETGPWLSRPMLAELGLPAPERRIGLAAHDVAQLMGAAEVYLTRAEKVDGAPTVPSRWLLRLEAILQAAGAEGEIRQGDWLAWAATRDAVTPAPPQPRPAPAPPVAARPKRLSVTRIEEWIANPYAIFARHILGLHKLDPLAPAPDAALRGTVIHAVLGAFARAHPERLPDDVAAEVMRLAQAELAEVAADPVVRAFWRPQLARFARWFAASEPERRRSVARVHAEIDGELAVPGADFTVTARADRLDVREDGRLALYDYKTGAVPSAKKVASGYAPQLPLEAAIAAAGGFDGAPRGETALMRYIRVLGRGEGGEEIDAAKDDPAALARDALEQLAGLAAAFAREETPYRALRRPAFASAGQYRYDDYEHLARVGEWSAGGAEA